MWKRALLVAVAAVTAAGCSAPDRSTPAVVPAATVAASPSATAAVTFSPPAPAASAAIGNEVPAWVPTTTAPPGQRTGTGTSGSGGRSGSGSCGTDYYRNSDGQCVHRPADRPAGATARCKDGTYSYSTHRQGTCSHHGGVAVWY
jgi:Protein of unknown function (DUF3761)